MTTLTARAGRGATALGWPAGLAAGALAALVLAADAGVAGAGAAPDVIRAGTTAIVVFGVCGWAPARLLTPAALADWRALFVLPLGAMTCGLALTILGFAAVPFDIALALTLASGLAAAVWSRRVPVERGTPDPVVLAAVAGVVLLIAAVALIPTFRSGLATVTGFGSDAHQVTGSATLLQREYPTAVAPELPVDRVPLTWRSKYPIYYALAAVSSVAGLEPWQALMTVSALLLAVAATGFFLLARSMLGAPAGVAVAAMAIAVLDRWVFHIALHPYYNQLWGLLTLPFSLVLGWAWVRDRSRRTLAALVLVTGVGALAYPLMLPFPLLAIAGFLVMDRDHPRPDPRRLWRGRRSLAWMVPLALLLAVPIWGVVEKFVDAARILANPSERLRSWQGDLQHFPPASEFFALPDLPGAGLALLAILVLAGITLWRLPRRVGVPLGAVLGLALAWAVWFRSVRYGQYFYFKILSFAAPQILVLALAAYSRRLIGAAVAVALCAGAVLAARDEIGISFDQLTPQTIELREWSDALPPGASVRLDTPPAAQLWQAYFLSDHPLGSPRPITDYPHVPYSVGGDYALDETLRPPPADAVGAPVRRNSALRLWRLRRGQARDSTSRRQVQTITNAGF